MANTTNLSLGKLAGTENLKNFPTVQSDNMDKIDQAVGAGFGSTRNVGGVTDALADAIAILANGNTHAAITSGQYVYVKNHASLTEGLYVATTNIAANATLSGSNLSADSSGGLNAALAGAKSYTDGLIGTVPSGNTVEGQITSLSNQIANLIKSKTYNSVSPSLMRGSTNEYILRTDLVLTGTQIISVYVSDRNGYGFVPFKDAIDSNYWQLIDPHNTELTGSFSFTVYYVNKQ